MKNIMYSLCLLPLLGHAGGDIQPIDMNYDQTLNADAVVIVEPIKPPAVETALKDPVIIPDPPVEHHAVAKPVVAPSPFYVGLSAGSAEIDGRSSNFIINNFHPKLAVGKLGYNVLENLAIEGRGGIGIKNDDISEVDKLVGAYLKPNINVTDSINLYGLLGYAKVKHLIDNEAFVMSGASFGLGAAYGLTDNLSLTADAVRYGKKDEQRLDAYTVGLDYNF
jgi:hypothetical protein